MLFARGLKNAYPDLDVTIREADVAPLQVQGPKSKDLMVKLLGPEILDLKYYFWTEAKIAEAPVVVTRTGWTSEIGYEVYLTDSTKGTDVFEAIMEAGEEFGIVPTGPSDIRRIEGAIFNWGADMTYENNPIEMGLDRLVAWDLADEASISIAALRRIRETGVDPKDQRRRVRRGRLPRAQQREVARFRGRRAGREGHVGDPLSTAREEHRLLLAPGGSLLGGRVGDGRDRMGRNGRRPWCRCRSSIPDKTIPVS